MSLIRTALRFQVIETLNADPVLDAMVQGRVYDSRISAFDHKDPVPTILVTAEETKGEGWSHQNGGAPFNTACDLILEIAMNAVASIQVEGQDAPVEAIAYAATDQEMEADLDLIEDRAIEVLTRGETAQAQLLRDAVVRRVPSFATSRFATDQTGEKFAVHLLTLRIDLHTPADEDPREPPTGPYAALPQPLRAIAEAAQDEAVRATCDRLLTRLTLAVQPAPPRFAGADMILAPQVLDPSVAPDRAGDIAAARTVALAADIPAP